MGINASTVKGHKDASQPPQTPPSEPDSAEPGQLSEQAEDAAMTESEADDGVEGTFNALKVKDELAWKHGERPRSALKHSVSDRSSIDEFVERTPSGRKLPRKVSFQVNGLAPPVEVEEGPKEKRVKKLLTDESSMKKLVDTFYGKVMTEEGLKVFFDDVDMAKLMHQQEALMLLVFGGHDLLEDELPGLSADLRLIHLHLLAEGLNLDHWQVFADRFAETIDQAPGIPDDVRAKAKEYMQGTRHYFRPLEAGEWPPAQPYKGWTKKSCPFAAGAAAARLQREEQAQQQEQEKAAGQELALAAAAPEAQQGTVQEAS